MEQVRMRGVIEHDENAVPAVRQHRLLVFRVSFMMNSSRTAKPCVQLCKTTGHNIDAGKLFRFARDDGRKMIIRVRETGHGETIV
jgi:hypothetical protein